MTEIHTPETDLLFQHFATLATGPDGIARLRELILQLAVQGKLGTQYESDEPASLLLERIRKEKERLVKEGKIKASKSLPFLREDEIQYSLPQGWIWTSFNDILLEAQSGFACGERDSNGIIQLRMNNVNTIGNFVWEKIIKIPKDTTKDLEKFILNTGDVLFNNTNSVELVGKSAVFVGYSEPVVYSNHFTRLRVVNNEPLPQFIALWLNYLWMSKIFENLCNRWIGQSAVNRNRLLSLSFPLPPLAEQHRIVEKVDRLMALCDQLEKQQQQERSTCLHLGTASFAGLQNAESPEEFERQWAQICDTFNLMLDCPENVAVLRQTILQLAVQGKLGTQDERDEPASVLLERIRTEKERLVGEGKIKASKSLPLIQEDELVYSVPKGWKIVRLGDVVNYNGRIKTDPKDIPKKAWLLELEDIEKDTSRIVQRLSVGERDPQSTKSSFKTGDVLYGKLRPYLNKVVVADEDGYCTTEIAPISTYCDILSEYLAYILKSPCFIEYVNSKSYGMKMPRLGTKDAIQAQFPLPPLAEQHRIVEKIDRLLALCDSLEANLMKRAYIHGLYTKAVTKVFIDK